MKNNYNNENIVLSAKPQRLAILSVLLSLIVNFILFAITIIIIGALLIVSGNMLVDTPSVGHVGGDLILIAIVLMIAILLAIIAISIPTFIIFKITSTVKNIIKINTTIVSFSETELIINNRNVSISMALRKINDVYIKTTLGGKIFNYSTIIINSTIKSKNLTFKFIKDAEEFKCKLVEQITKCIK